LQDLFVSVIEPFLLARAILTVERLPMAGVAIDRVD
jgi:hypothetical protein